MALLAVQDFFPVDVLMYVISLPILVIFWVVSILRNLVGCDLSLLSIVTVAGYAGYHTWVETFDEEAVLIWLSAGAGMVLLTLACEGDFSLAMLDL